MSERILSLDEWAAVILPKLIDEDIARGNETPFETLIGDAFYGAAKCVERSRKERDGRRQAVADDDGTGRTGG